MSMTDLPSEAVQQMGEVAKEGVAEVGKIIETTITAMKEYAIAKEHEKTERERIRATLAACLRKIDAEARAVSKKLDQMHEDRAKLYQLYGKTIAKASEDGDIELFKCASEQIRFIYSAASAETQCLFGSQTDIGMISDGRHSE